MFNFTCGGFFCCCFRILESPHVTILIAILGLCNCLPITCIIVLTTFTSSVCPLKYKGLIIHETEKTNKDSIYPISQKFVNSGEKSAKTVGVFSCVFYVAVPPAT